MIVTVAELKKNLHIQYDEENEYLASLIMQAQAAAEDFCRVTFSDVAPDVSRIAPGVPGLRTPSGRVLAPSGSLRSPSLTAPEPVRLAVKLMASFYYEYRDAPDKQDYIAMQMAFKTLIYPYRDTSKMF